MWSSIHLSSISSCSAVKPTAPSTPKPPALLTAATTSRQWVKAKIGYSIPSWSHTGVLMTSLLCSGVEPGHRAEVGRGVDVRERLVGDGHVERRADRLPAV